MGGVELGHRAGRGAVGAVDVEDSASSGPPDDERIHVGLVPTSPSLVTHRAAMRRVACRALDLVGPAEEQVLGGHLGTGRVVVDDGDGHEAVAAGASGRRIDQVVGVGRARPASGAA